jgi:site-specific DNA recombinase
MHLNVNEKTTKKEEIFNADRIVRATVYARTARIDQNAKYLEQINTCSDYIKEKGWILIDIFYDEGTSEVNIERPELSNMLLNAAKGCFDIVVVSNTDRLSRSLKDLSEIRQILSDFKVKIRAVDETGYVESLSAT